MILEERNGNAGKEGGKVFISGRYSGLKAAPSRLGMVVHCGWLIGFHGAPRTRDLINFPFN